MDVSTTTVRPLTQEEFICGQVAAAVLDNAYKFISIATALPLHIAIVFLLFLRVTKRRFYHYFIFIECGTDIVALVCVLVTHSLCVVFRKLIMNYVTYVAPPIQLILSVYLMVYWKTTIRPQRLLDIFLCIIAATSTVENIGSKLYAQYNQQPNDIVFMFIIANTCANLALGASCFVVFFLVLRMDMSRFSEVTVRGQRKMATALCLQLIFILITNVFDAIESYINYRNTMDPFVFQANVKATNVTDLVLIRQYQKELMDYLGPSQAVKETISVISSIWSALLPLLRGVLICWAIRPLLQKTKVVIINLSTTEVAPAQNLSHSKSF